MLTSGSVGGWMDISEHLLERGYYRRRRHSVTHAGLLRPGLPGAVYANLSSALLLRGKTFHHLG